MPSKFNKNVAALFERLIFNPPLLTDLQKAENAVKKRVDYACRSHHIYTSTFQTDFRINKFYFAYRWVMCTLCFTSCLFTSLDPLNRTEIPLSWYFKYLVYLTNWSLTVMWIQTLMGAVIITLGVKHFGFNKAVPIDQKIPKHQWIYWKLQELAILAEVSVSATFWLVINPRSQDQITLNGMLGHGTNSIYALTDWLISGLPFNFSDFWLLIVYAMFYFFFTYIYWEAGGTGRNKITDSKTDPRVIYAKCTDWNRPFNVFICFFICLTHAALAHVAVCAFNKLRVRWMPKPATPNSTHQRTEEIQHNLV